MHKELGLFYQFIYLFIYFDNMILIYYFFLFRIWKRKEPNIVRKEIETIPRPASFYRFLKVFGSSIILPIIDCRLSLVRNEVQQLK